MRRRDFVAMIGGCAIWPRTVLAQQSTIRKVGYLTPETGETAASLLSAFKKGLNQSGYTEGQNVSIEYRSADGRFDRLPALASGLVRQNVDVIVTIAGTITALAAKGATSSIPIIFVIGDDPVKAGLVASLNRPGGNLTGVNVIAGSLGAKLLEVLHQVVPSATLIGVFHNLNNPNAEPELRDLQAGAQKLGVQLLVKNASTPGDVEDGFSDVLKHKAGGLLVNPDPFLNSRVDQLVSLTAKHRLPAIYGYREFATAGGLMSYGTNALEARRQAAIYAARILNGEKPADLPVIQSTKVELVINLKTAKALGITFPLPLLGRADEVIE
jgi:putative tryptophan/tyrosine transport system substrate-binding protein